MLKKIAKSLINRAEPKLGVRLNYTHKIAQTDFGLLMRYNHIYRFLDGNKKASALASTPRVSAAQ